MSASAGAHLERRFTGIRAPTTSADPVQPRFEGLGMKSVDFQVREWGRASGL